MSETVWQVPRLDECLAHLRQLHARVCPRQVLGVRMGLEAQELFGLELPRTDKRLIALVETDGCFADGVSVATGCWLGRRTLRLVDYGKVATTLVDVQTAQAFRLAPHPGARLRASNYAPNASGRWHAQLAGYQRMPTDELLRIEPVEFELPLAKLLGCHGRDACSVCGEEILNQRGLAHAGSILCRACAGDGRYYRTLPLPEVP
jgi:formylmethanofuran dehydrogenase subunit E